MGWVRLLIDALSGEKKQGTNLEERDEGQKVQRWP